MATIPDRHPYLAAVLPPSIRHLGFAASDGPAWAPNPLLQLSVLVDALPEIDVLHLHFGYESLSSTAMIDWVAAVHASGTPLVVTVHDLRNPHQRDPSAHDRHLDTLMAAADEVLTLTAGAAHEIAERWHRHATVVAHPSLADGRPTGPPAAGQIVGIHLKSLRANVIEPHRIVRAAVAGVRDTSAVVRVDVHPESQSHADLSEIRASADRGEIELCVHDRYDDRALLDYLQGLHVSVLPYRFGTHSGWLELCRDLGTAVVAPDCGYYTDQWPAILSYSHNEITGLDEDSLSAAVRRAVDRSRPVLADPDERASEREAVRHQHAAIYDRVLARSPARP